MSRPTTQLPALAALLATGISHSQQEGLPQTPKETIGSTLQGRNSDGAACKEALLAAVIAPTETEAKQQQIGSDTDTAAAAAANSSLPPLKRERDAAEMPEEKLLLPQENPWAFQGEEAAEALQEQQQQKEEEEQEDNEGVVDGLSKCKSLLSVDRGVCPPVASASDCVSASDASRGVSSLSLHHPSSRQGHASDRSGEWHPLDAVVERIESYVRPGGGAQRLQWSKGFRMPLGAEGRQILLRRLRKAYHSDPLKWDEELSRHRIVFSRMPYATVIELFHLAHLFGVFDFAVKCSEEYGSDAAGAAHRRRRAGRAAAAAAAPQTPGTHSDAAAAAGETVEGGAAGCLRSTRGAQGGSRKTHRRQLALSGSVDGSHLPSERPKRATRFIPSYLRDYEMLAEPFRMPPAPVKKTRSSGQANTAAAAPTAAAAGASANSLLSWNGSSKNAIELQQLQHGEDFLAAAISGHACASAHEALLRAVDEQTATAAAAAAAEEAPIGSSFSSQHANCLLQGRGESEEFSHKLWGCWPQPKEEPAETVSSCLGLPLAAAGSSIVSSSKLEGELRDLRLLLLNGQQTTKRQMRQQTSATDHQQTNAELAGRLFFSAEIPADLPEHADTSFKVDRHQKLRSSSSNSSSNEAAAALQQRRYKKTKTTPLADAAVSSVAAALAGGQLPSLADLPVGAEASRHEGTAAAAAAAAAAAGDGSDSQLNLHLLTTNYTIAAQYLQVLELLAVQRQIMELTQTLGKGKTGEAAGSNTAAAAEAAAGSAANSQRLLAAAGTAKLDCESVLNQQLLLELESEGGFAAAAQQQQQQAAGPVEAAAAAAAQVSVLKAIEKKVEALETRAAERGAAAAAPAETAANATSTKNTQNSKFKRYLSRQSALSCSMPESPLDGEDASAASPCCSGSSALSACNTPDSLGGERLLLLSSLWQPLPPAEGLAAGNR